MAIYLDHRHGRMGAGRDDEIRSESRKDDKGSDDVPGKYEKI